MKSKLSWDDVSEILEGILDRQYYTNHGPLAQELEFQLQNYFCYKNALCVTNKHIGIMLALKCILPDMKKIRILNKISPETLNLLKWLNIRIVNRPDAKNIPEMFSLSDSYSYKIHFNNKSTVLIHDLYEIGGCILTDDNYLAEMIRNMRSSYGRRKEVEIPVGGYGRLSEIQAGIILYNLEKGMI